VPPVEAERGLVERPRFQSEFPDAAGAGIRFDPRQEQSGHPAPACAGAHEHALELGGVAAERD